MNNEPYIPTENYNPYRTPKNKFCKNCPFFDEICKFQPECLDCKFGRRH